MKKFYGTGWTLFLILSAVGAVWAAEATTPRDSLFYQLKHRDPVIEEITDELDRIQEAREAVTDSIHDFYRAEEKREKDEQQSLLMDFSKIRRPAASDDFQSSFHFPPIRQYLTGTCWCFCTTSMLESEVYRQTGQKIKLSEMHTVYYEYLLKAQRFIRERGHSAFGQGSEGNAVIRVFEKYGAVPAEVYPGVRREDGRHAHREMIAEMKDYLTYIEDNDRWDEELNLAAIKHILDKYLGPPPEKFEYEGQTMTPQTFVTDILKLNLKDYVSVMSTLKQPFYEFGEFDVYDNWWKSKEYYNVPLADFYTIIKTAVQDSFTLMIGGDVSEAGINGLEDTAIVPTFDIPRDYIDQYSREYRIDNETTTDDHGIHIVGYTELAGDDWFLIKDSGSAGHWGRHPGYYFYREDFVKLKMLTILIHRDAIKINLPNFD